MFIIRMTRNTKKKNTHTYIYYAEEYRIFDVTECDTYS
jgi:hypothetical protein